MIQKLYVLIAMAILLSIGSSTSELQADDSCFFGDPGAVEDPDFCKNRKKPFDAFVPEGETSPNFSDVDDILLGVRSVLPVQDFVLMNPTAGLPSQGQLDATFTARDFFAFTENNSIVEAQGPFDIRTLPCNPSGTGPFIPYGLPSPQQTNPARMFNLDRDVVVTYAPQVDENKGCVGSINRITVQDPLGLINLPNLDIRSNSDLFIPSTNMQSVVADFNGDGYDDILIIAGRAIIEIFVISAVNPDNPTQGVKISPRFTLPNTMQAAMSSPVAGDFNGDNIVDIAWVGSGAINLDTYNIFFASICPGPTPDTPLCQGRSQFEVILNPLSSQAIPLDTFVDRAAQFAYPASALAVGEFSIILGDELVVIYGQPNGGYNVEYYTFDDSMAPTLRDSFSQPWVLYNAYAEAAQFDLSQAGEQVVIAQQINNGCPLWLINFGIDDKFEIFGSDWIGPVSGNGVCDQTFRNPSDRSLNGMTIGRFTSADATTFQQLAPQIAVYIADYLNVGNQVRILTVNAPDDLFPRFLNVTGIGLSGTESWFGQFNPNRGGSFLKAGDLQGRSLVLGTPDVARVSNWLEVNTIIGSPPMHTAYIRTLGQSEPEINNFSVTPRSFNTGFTTGTNSGTTSSTRDTASWSMSYEIDGEFNSKFKIPGIIALGVDGGFSYNKTVECNLEQVNDSYTGSQDLISTKTGFSDLIVYTESRKNIYFYPVIGQTVCPDGSDDCNPSERQPLFYQIAAPDQISTNLVEGRSAEYYQPPHQPGNILTYPATRAQLLERFNSTQSSILSEPTLGFLTNNSIFTQIKQWNQGQGNQCTTDTSKTNTYNPSGSISVGAGIIDIFDFAGLKITANFDYVQSDAIGTNITSGSTTTDSIGIEVIKPDSFLDPVLYQYLVNSYIFGEPFPDGVWQALFNDGQTAANITSTGPLVVAFTSNALSTDAGSWWATGGVNGYLQYPDIGLNFPTRWRDVGVSISGVPPPDCRLNGSSTTQATCTWIRPAPESSEELWASGFYHLRGFFIQAGMDIDPGIVAAPSQTYVYTGDTINIATRIYNLSLKEFAPTDVIKVQFYRQQWDNTLNLPIGDSILIEEQSISPIPPFTDSDIPNWNLVGTSINTTEANMGPGKYWVFWVVVYPVDQNGDLVQELPGYGFDPSEFQPGSIFKSILDVPLEKVSVSEFTTEVERSLTNNVGFYKNAVYVAPLPNNTGDDIESTIFVDNVTVTPSEIFVGEETILKADIYSMDAASDGVTVLFHDRHPDEAEIAYDIEVLSNIEKDSLHNVQVAFQAEFCGEHELHISAADNGIGNEGTDIVSTILNVVCQPGDTNIDGELIGDDGQPVSTGSNGGNCSLAPANTRAEIPFYLIVPLLFVAMRFGYRKLYQ